jgi:hypothetical protein
MKRRDRVLMLIALFRWGKALLLIAGGFAILRLLDARLPQWLTAFPKAMVFLARLDP